MLKYGEMQRDSIFKMYTIELRLILIFRMGQGQKYIQHLKANKRLRMSAIVTLLHLVPSTRYSQSKFERSWC